MIPGLRTGLVGGSAGEEEYSTLPFLRITKRKTRGGCRIKVQISEVQELELAPVDGALFAQYGLEEEQRKTSGLRSQNMERELRNAIEASVKPSDGRYCRGA